MMICYQTGVVTVNVVNVVQMETEPFVLEKDEQ